MTGGFGGTGLELSILITARETAGAVIKALGGQFGLLGSGLKNMAAGFGNLFAFGGTGRLMEGFTQTGKALLMLGAAAAVVGVVIAAYIGVKAVQAAGDFQRSITKLYTTAGELHGNLKMVGDGILSMSADVGTGAQQLVDAMYYVESGNYHGAAALEVLRIAAMGAKAENANLNDVAKSVVFTMNAYAAQHMSAATAMNILIASTARGVMTLQELSSSLHSVLPATAKFHISMIDVGAAMATMTAQGDPAAQAATHLRQMILALEAPSKIGAASLKLVGLTSQQVSDEMKISLPGAIKMITDAVGKKFPEGSAAYNQAIKNIAGGSKQMMGFLELSGTHLKTFMDNVNGVTDAVHKGGNSILGWADVQNNWNFKMDQARAAVGAFLIGIGEQLLPKLTQIASAIIPIIISFTQWIVQSHIVESAIGMLADAIGWLITTGASIVAFFQHNEIAMDLLKGVLVALAIIIAVSVVSALYAWAVAAWTAAAGMIALTWPILLVIAAVALLVGAFIYLYNNWAGFRSVVNSVVDALKVAWAWIVQMTNVLIGGIGPAIRSVVAAFVNFYAHATLLRTFVATVSSALSWLWGIIVQVATVLYNNIGPALQMVGAFFQWLWNAIQPGIAFLGRLWAWLVQVGTAFVGNIGPALVATGVFFRQLWAAIQQGVAIVKPYLIMMAAIVRDQFIPVWHQLQDAWKQIAPLGAQLVGAFKMIWATVQQLAAVFMSQLMPTLKSTWGSLQALWQVIGPFLLPALKTLGIIIGGILLVSLGLLVGVLMGVTGAIAMFLRGVIMVITGITQFLTGLVQFVTGIVSLIVDIFTGKWGKLAADLNMISQGMLNMMRGVWNIMLGLVVGTLGAIYGFIKGFIDGVIGFFTILYHQLVGGSIIPDMVNGILNWFSNLVSQGIAFITSLVTEILMWMVKMEAMVLSTISAMVAMFLSWLDRMTGGAVSRVSNLIGQVQNLLGQLPGIALSAGKALMQGIVDGINAGIGWVSNAINNVVSTISNMLPHSPAKVGPLRDLNKYGPALVSGFSEGIIKSTPLMQHAMNVMLQPVQTGTMGLHGLPPRTAGSTSGGGGGLTINVQIGNINDFSPNMPITIARRITDAVEKEMSRRYRGQWNNASGGVN